MVSLSLFLLTRIQFYSLNIYLSLGVCVYVCVSMCASRCAESIPIDRGSRLRPSEFSSPFSPSPCSLNSSTSSRLRGGF